MENQNENVTQTVDTQGAGTTTAQTATGDADKGKAKALSSKTTKKPNTDSGRQQAKSKKPAGVDTSDKNAGTGKEGDNTQGTVMQAPEVPETPSDLKRSKIADGIFRRFPRITSVFFTSDRMPFGEKNDAIKHAAGLSDKTIIVHQKK